MPQYSRADILNQNTNDFPNNNSGQITPQILRDYNANVANSVVFIGEPVSSSLSASFAATASLARTASFAINAAQAATATTASYAIQAQNAVNANTANTALYADNAGSASYAATASISDSTVSASFAQTSISSSYSFNSTSASYALTASFAANAPTINTSSFVTTSSFNAYTASTNTFTQSIQTQVNSLTAATSSYITSAQTSSMSVLSASFAATASFLTGTIASASYAVSASYALNSTSASFATNSANGFPFTGSARITGSLGVTGSLSTTLGIEVKSGDLDFSGGNINIYNGNINQFVGATTLRNTTISGSALITGSLGVTGSITTTGNIFADGTNFGVGSPNNANTLFTAQAGTSSAFEIVANGPNPDSTFSLATTNGGAGFNFHQLKIQLVSNDGITFGDVASGGTFTNNSFLKVDSYASTPSIPGFTRGLSVTGSLNAPSITGSLLGTASFASTIASGLNITASNILVNNNLIVNGTASFAYTRTTSGSAVIIGDEFIILNADTPFAPFAGIKVYDTGSASTASLEWNGLGDYWIQVDEAGNSGAMLTGPTGSKGTEAFPTANTLLKGTGTPEVVNSNITDNGSTVSINSNTLITGSLNITAGITGSLLGTASFANNANSASYATQALSSSYALTASFLQGNVVSASYAATASSADAFNVRLSLTASGLRYPTTDGTVEQFLSTDGAGSLSFANVRTLYQNIRNLDTSSIVKGTPLFVSGSTGDNANVFVADAGNPARMPATLIAGDNTLAPNATGRGIILGHIEGVNTTGYPAGTLVYVGVGGGWTSTAPTGSAQVQPLGVVTRTGTNGMGIVLTVPPNSLPNIQSGFTWVGDANGVPQAVSTSSLLVTSASYSLNSTSASYSVNSTSASYALNSTSASFAQTAISASFAPSTPAFPFTGSAAISGSLTLVGDQYMTGSLIIRPTTLAGEQPFILTEASDGTAFEGNLIMYRNTFAANTGSVSISGSNNIFMPSVGIANATIAAGAGAGWNGRSSILTTGVITVIGTNGSGYNRQYPTFINSVVNAGIAITDNRPSGTTGAPLTLSGAGVNGSVTMALNNTGSLTVSNSNIVGVTLLNHTNATAGTFSNSVIGTGTINGNSSAVYFSSNIFMGGGSAQIDSGNLLFNSLIVGNTLIVTGSAGTANQGTAIVGRFNDTGSTAVVANTAFAVGTGTSNTVRRTSFHVSSSGLVTATNSMIVTGSLTVGVTTPELTVLSTGVTLGNVLTDVHTVTGSFSVTGSLNAATITGSLLGTASFATSASYALNSTSASYALTSTSASFSNTSTSASFANNSTSASYALTASYAMNGGGGGGVAAGDIYSYTFLLMGA